MVGIEPTLAVLETAVLPLNDTPKETKLFLCLFVLCMRPAPFAELFQSDGALHLLFILESVVIKTLTLPALHFY